MIWTTTPWTLPANQALDVHPDVRPTAGRHGARRAVLAARSRRRRASSATGSPASRSRRARAWRSRGSVPPSVLRRDVAGPSRRLRHARLGHRHRPHLARVRHRGLQVVPPLRHEGRRHAERRCRPTAAIGPTLPLFGGLKIWEANPKILDEAPRSAARCCTREVHAQLHALLAPQDADHLSRDDAMVRRHGQRAGLRRKPPRRCATRRCAPSRRRASSRRGSRAWRHDREPSRLDAVAPAPLGAPLPFFLDRIPTSRIRTRRR